MLFESNEKIKFGVFFDLNAQFIKALDRCITCKEILRTWSECNDLEVTNADNGTCNRYEITDHLGDVISCSNWIFRNVCFKMTHL